MCLGNTKMYFTCAVNNTGLTIERGQFVRIRTWMLPFERFLMNEAVRCSRALSRDLVIVSFYKLKVVRGNGGSNKHVFFTLSLRFFQFCRAIISEYERSVESHLMENCIPTSPKLVIKDFVHT